MARQRTYRLQSVRATRGPSDRNTLRLDPLVLMSDSRAAGAARPSTRRLVRPCGRVVGCEHCSTRRTGGPEVLEWAEAPEPHAGLGQVRVAVRAASVNPIDWKVFTGMLSDGEPMTGTGGAVSFAVAAFDPRDCRHETSPPSPAPMPRSAFAGFRFPPDVIVLAVRWYLRFGLSYRDVEELLTERGIEVDHVTVYRWVLRFTPLLADAAKPCRHTVGDRWQVDETYVKVAGRWRYVYRAIDQFGQVIDVFVSARRDADAAHRFFERAIGTTKVAPVEVVTDRAPTYPQVLDELLPAAWHRTDRYANNRVEADHGRLKARLRPMRGLKQDRSARVIAAGTPSSRTFAGSITNWRSRSR
jgi:transposase-like protein